MKTPLFLKVGKKPLLLNRFPTPYYVKGLLVQPPPTKVTIQANIQPATKQSGSMPLPEEVKTKKALFVWSASEIKQKIDHGATKQQADYFVYENELFEVIKVIRYNMGVLDHYEALAIFVNPAEISEPSLKATLNDIVLSSEVVIPT